MKTFLYPLSLTLSPTQNVEGEGTLDPLIHVLWGGEGTLHPLSSTFCGGERELCIPSHPRFVGGRGPGRGGIIIYIPSAWPHTLLSAYIFHHA